MQHKKIVFLCLILSFLCLLTSCGGERVTISQGASMTAYFTYGDKNVDNPLVGEDRQAILTMFSGKKLYRENVPCAFTEKACLIIDGKHYCVADDRCNIIYLKEQDQYFNLSAKEYDLLSEILGYYGLTFPIEE
jgi:hypothetical protein